MAQGRQVGVVGQEVMLYLLELVNACIGPLFAHVRGRAQVLNLQSLIGCRPPLLNWREAGLAHDERCITRSQEAGPEGILVEGTERGDADKVGQLGSVL